MNRKIKKFYNMSVIYNGYDISYQYEYAEKTEASFYSAFGISIVESFWRDFFRKTDPYFNDKCPQSDCVNFEAVPLDFEWIKDQDNFVKC